MKKQVRKRRAARKPKNVEEASDFVRQIGEADRTIENLSRTMDELLENIKEGFVKDLRVHQDRRARLFEGLCAFANEHREGLTNGGKVKSISFSTGSFGWRMKPKSVSVKDAEAVLAALKNLGLKRFIRVREELDKQAMLREEEVASGVDGVTVGQQEEFFVKPSQVRVDTPAVAGDDSLKTALSRTKKRAKKKTA